MYDWALNRSKLQRAEAMCPGQGEEVIKQAYIKLGGKVVESVAPTPETPTETIQADEIPVVAPKEKKSKSKKSSISA